MLEGGTFFMSEGVDSMWNALTAEVVWCVGGACLLLAALSVWCQPFFPHVVHLQMVG